MLSNEFIALELHRIRVTDQEKTPRTPNKVVNEIIAEHREEKRRTRRNRRNK